MLIDSRNAIISVKQYNNSYLLYSLHKCVSDFGLEAAKKTSGSAPGNRLTGQLLLSLDFFT